jgi:hypothetical protein
MVCFQIKNPGKIWVNFGETYNGRCWYIILPFGVLYGHLVHFVAILYILWLVGSFAQFWLAVRRKIW